MSLVFVFAVAAPLVECCLALTATAAPPQQHHEHQMPGPAPAREMPFDCHGSTEAPAPAPDDCCLFAATNSPSAPGEVLLVAKSGSDLAPSPVVVNEAPILRPAAHANAPPEERAPAPPTRLYLLVSSFLI